MTRPTQWEECPDCAGTGIQHTGRVDQPKAMVCIECDGRGEIKVEIEEDEEE